MLTFGVQNPPPMFLPSALEEDEEEQKFSVVDDENEEVSVEYEEEEEASVQDKTVGLLGSEIPSDTDFVYIDEICACLANVGGISLSAHQYHKCATCESLRLAKGYHTISLSEAVRKPFLHKPCPTCHHALDLGVPATVISTSIAAAVPSVPPSPVTTPAAVRLEARRKLQEAIAAVGLEARRKLQEAIEARIAKFGGKK
jgi:hypothetical protein